MEGLRWKARFVTPITICHRVRSGRNVTDHESLAPVIWAPPSSLINFGAVSLMRPIDLSISDRSKTLRPFALRKTLLSKNCFIRVCSNTVKINERNKLDGKWNEQCVSFFFFFPFLYSTVCRGTL